MKDPMKEMIMAQYPEWHNNPLRLTIAEIETPQKVIQRFFDRYSLPQIRACLKDMLFDAIWMDDNDAPEHISTHDDVEKLIEAAWLLKEGRVKKHIAIAEAQRVEWKDLPKGYMDINEFFDSITLPKSLEYLNTALKAAEAMEIWKMSTPNNLVTFFESLEGLVRTVYKIMENNVVKKVVLNKKVTTLSLSDCQYYCADYDQLTPWDYFPRSLSKKEYRDPYKALERFTTNRSIKEWKEILDYVMNGALGASSLTEAGVYLELFTIAGELHKMIEACHLIYVRTTYKTVTA